MTSSVEDNGKLLHQLETGFKRAVNWNKYQSKPTLQTQSWYFNFIIDPSFQGVNKPFVLSLENDRYRESYKCYFFLTVKTTII